MKPEESLKQKLARYKKTLEYVNEVELNEEFKPESKRLEEATRPETTQPASGKAIAQVNKQLSEGNIEAVRREIIRTLSEIDPANPTLNTLLNATNLSPEKLREITVDFARSYRIRLQDETNNLSLSEAQAREAEKQLSKSAEDEEPSTEPAEQTGSHTETQSENKQSSSESNQPVEAQSTRSEKLAPRQMTQKEAYGQYKEANKAARDERARKLREDRNKRNMSKDDYGKYKQENNEDRKKRAEELWKRRGLIRPGSLKGGWNPLGDWLGKKIAEKIAQSKIGQAVARNFIDPVKQAIQNSRAWQAVAPRIKPLADAFNRFASPFRSALNALGAPERWLNTQMGNIANAAGRGLLNVGSQAIRGLGNQISNLFNAARPVAGQIGAGAAAIGTGIVYAGSLVLAVITSVAFWVVVALVGLFVFSWWYSNQLSNTNCDKPGQMEVKKILENLHSGENNVKNGEQIDYQIQINYIWLCDKITLPSVTITDTVPRSVEYVEGSAKSGSFAYGSGPEGVYNEANRTITWTLTNVSSNDPYGVSFSVTPFPQSDGSWSLQDTWLQNQATVTYRAPTTKSSGDYADVTGLLPNPAPPPPSNWDSVKAQILAAYTKHPELIDTYKQASAETGVPWQVLAGLHFVETGSGPGPDSSLVSGRKIGQVEPDVSPVKCASGVTGPGSPVPKGGGCGFSTQLDSAIYAGHHIAEKIGKVPSTFSEAVEAMSKYNGGGNANCGEGLAYGPCPPQFFGEDDPYAMADFDEPHASSNMFIIFCADFTRCNPARPFNRPGAMGVVRALIEEGL